jgi:2-polyprenyl-3-methyl-5-hydroxy-6-metoxy-1,4-benzoquinol methylase
MEARLFPEGTVPEYCTAEWYAGRDSAPHVDEPLHRPRLELAAEHVRWVARDLGLRSLSDLGAGDGGLLWLLRQSGLNAWGYDLQQTNCDAAEARGVAVQLRDVLADASIVFGDIAVTTEMLEHLVDPHAFVRRLLDDWERGPRAVVASSPRTETAEAHYEFHTWAWDTDGYRALFEDQGWLVVRHEPRDMFQVLTAVRP